MASLKGPEGLVAEVVAYRPQGNIEALDKLEKLRRRSGGRGAIAPLRTLEQPRLLAIGLDDPEKDADVDADAHPFRADLVDRATGQHYTLLGQLDATADATLVPVDLAHPPQRTEVDGALRALARDPEVGAAVRRGELRASPAMPGAVVASGRDGRPRRAITIALHGRKHPDGAGYRIVEVDPVDRVVLGTRSTGDEAECGALEGPDTSEASSGGMVHVKVRDGKEPIWELVVVRPNALPADSSFGLAVRNVEFRGRRVLHRGDTPILNVKYDAANHDGAVSYRDWTSSEPAFRASGKDVIPGYRLCRKAPRTVFDVNSAGQAQDGGNFTGVTFHWDGTTLVVTSMMMAGWYRYRAEWRFAANGEITPTFGFTAVKNQNTCDPHTHHCYWRFDFDIDTAGHNAVQRRVGYLGSHLSLGDPRTLAARMKDVTFRWEDVDVERRMVRGPLSAWRVLNTKGKRGYILYPSLRDGHADSAFGVGDVWAVRYRPRQDRDAKPDSGEDKAHIDPYVNRDSIKDTDVVLWYAAHARHDQHEDDIHDVHGHIVGPRLAPWKW